MTWTAPRAPCASRPSWSGATSLVALAEEASGLPVTVDNDVRALTVAEQWFGDGVGLSDFAVVTVGAGIGCGLVVHGRVVSGSHGVAGEIGHVQVVPDGLPCRCGDRGCLEAVASDAAITARVREVTGVLVADATEALALARAGDEGRAPSTPGRGGHRPGDRHRGQSARSERVIISGEGLAAYDLFAGQVRDAFAAAAFGSAAAASCAPARCRSRSGPGAPPPRPSSPSPGADARAGTGR